MTEELFIKNRGWRDAENETGWMACVNDDVLAWRYNWGPNGTQYCLCVHNLKGIRYIDRIVPHGVKTVTLFNVSGKETNDEAVQKIIDKLELRSPVFVNFDRLPRLKRIKCFGTHESVQCNEDAIAFITDNIDGYTDSKVAVCANHIQYWKDNFDGLTIRETLMDE